MKFGSSGEYEIKDRSNKIPKIEIEIPVISINLLTIKIITKFPSFFMSIYDESNIPLCII